MIAWRYAADSNVGLLRDGNEDAAFAGRRLFDQQQVPDEAAFTEDDTLAKVAEAMSVQSFVGGKTLVDVVGKVFTGTPLAGVLDRIAERGLLFRNHWANGPSTSPSLSVSVGV